MTPTIVHVASGREWRGGQKQVWLLARALRDLGVAQLVVTGRDSELARRLAADGIPTRTPRWTMSVDPRALWATWRAAAPGTVLHAHDAHALSLALVAARRCRVPVVVTRRVDFHLRHPARWARARQIIAISEGVRRVLVADGVPPGLISVVPDGVALDDVRAVAPYGTRSRLGLAPGTPLAVNVAALVDHKDQATLLAAAAHLRTRLPGLHWAIAGSGPLREPLEREIAARGLTGVVHLLGQVPDGVAVIADADVFVMSSKEEGLGSSILDAMARGVPVVATRAGGIPDLLGAGAGALVSIGDSAALATAVEEVLERPDRRQTLVERALQTVQAYSDRAMAERMLAVYRSLSQQPTTQ